MIPWLTEAIEFPAPEMALRPPNPNGLLAAGGDLSPQRLLAAYQRGIFPWFSPGDPILWWSPAPRMVLYPSELKISRSLDKTLRNTSYEVKLDTAFPEVIKACAAQPREGQNGTWICPEMVEAYTELHRRGFAHSVETWIDGTLQGGLYGIALGRVFFGESMFSLRKDTSKIALAHLCAHLINLDVAIIDCQMETRHLASLGAKPIDGEAFLAEIKSLVATSPGLWSATAITGHFQRTLEQTLSPSWRPAE